ncbi:MAG: hypothetical protein RPR97_02280, partial [Colwellia sp.]
NGKANYPEIAAYRDYFASEYEVLDGDLDAYQLIENKSDCIAWCIMGFFPNKIEAKQVIHDYRSLSVGRFPVVKDQIKRIFNAKPNLRIFQNTIMEDAMGFNDGIKSCILPMGVPEYIFDVAKEMSSEYLAKFCYIGEISYEREMNLVLQAFIDNEIKGDFVLIGEPESRLYEKFSKYGNIRFVGRKPQSETLRMVKQCEFAVCSLPYHRPYSFQAATKLLEYLALGMKVICNPAPSNKMVCENLNAGEVFMSSKYIFDQAGFKQMLESVSQTSSGKYAELGWEAVINKSSIAQFLN